MFDLGWSEMAIVMLVALIVIGPKDLPKVARTIGQWTGKARALARDFQRSLDDMAREAELDEIKKSIDKVGNTSLRQVVKDAVDPDDDLERAFDIDDNETTKKPRARSNAKPVPATSGPKTALPAAEKGASKQAAAENSTQVTAATKPPKTASAEAKAGKASATAGSEPPTDATTAPAEANPPASSGG